MIICNNLDLAKKLKDISKNMTENIVVVTCSSSLLE